MPSSHPAFTIVETTAVLTIVGVCAAAGGLMFRSVLDSASVRAASAELAGTLRAARTLALARGGASAHIDTERVEVRAGGALVIRRDLAASHGVHLAPSRDSLAFGATGLGRGAANLSIVVRRGAARDTVVVSRLGRVRH
ncbi:MAG TPA: hypothetical protein VFY16_14550 [Gemmatimonadaceae bacterium]|nr:hypothetical protein [Gemmatimonadaceae bacterium]